MNKILFPAAGLVVAACGSWLIFDRQLINAIALIAVATLMIAVSKACKVRLLNAAAIVVSLSGLWAQLVLGWHNQFGELALGVFSIVLSLAALCYLVANTPPTSLVDTLLESLQWSIANAIAYLLPAMASQSFMLFLCGVMFACLAGIEVILITSSVRLPESPS